MRFLIIANNQEEMDILFEQTHRKLKKTPGLLLRVIKRPRPIIETRTGDILHWTYPERFESDNHGQHYDDFTNLTDKRYHLYKDWRVIMKIRDRN